MVSESGFSTRPYNNPTADADLLIEQATSKDGSGSSRLIKLRAAMKTVRPRLSKVYVLI